MSSDYVAYMTTFLPSVDALSIVVYVPRAKEALPDIERTGAFTCLVFVSKL